MTETRAIVVAEQDTYDLLAASGLGWDLQNRVETIAALWDGLSGGTLDRQSRVLVFSASLADTTPGDAWEEAVAAMAPHAAVFVRAAEAQRGDLQRRISAATPPDGPHGDVHFVDEDPTSTIAGLRETALRLGVPVAEPPARPAPAPSVDSYMVPNGAPPLLDPVSPATAHAVVETPATPIVAPTAPVAPAPEAALAAAAVDAVHLAAPIVPPPAAPPISAPPLVTTTPAGTSHSFTPTSGTESPDGPVLPPIIVPPSAEAPGVIDTDGHHLFGADAAAAQTQPQGRARGRVLTFFSNKGGAGKSTTAIMTATTIAQGSAAAGRPLKVVLVDMDTRDGQVASFIQTYTPTALNIRAKQDWGPETIQANLVPSKNLMIDCLLAPVRPRTADDVGPDFYRHVINVLRTTHDVVILDCSVAYLDPLIATVCLPEADRAVFITTMAAPAVEGMARSMREMREAIDSGGVGVDMRKVGVVLNQTIDNVHMTGQQVVQAALGAPLIGAIPVAFLDLLNATNTGRLYQLVKHPALGRAYHRLAQALLQLDDDQLKPLFDKRDDEASGDVPQPSNDAGPDVSIVDSRAQAAAPPAPAQATAPLRRILSRKGA